MQRLRLIFSTLMLATVLAACGGSATAPSNDELTSEANGRAGSDDAWWFYERPNFFLADGGFTPEEVGSSTGFLWSLEYAGERTTLGITARDREWPPIVTSREEHVGSATVDGFDATLWRHQGYSDDEIPPSVGAKWKDGDVFMSFGGAALTEVELREHLRYVRRVTREEWQAAVEAVQEQKRQIRENQAPATTGLTPD